MLKFIGKVALANFVIGAAGSLIAHAIQLFIEDARRNWNSDPGYLTTAQGFGFDSVEEMRESMSSAQERGESFLHWMKGRKTVVADNAKTE